MAKNIAAIFTIFLSTLLLATLSQVSCNKQIHSLSRFYREKLKKNNTAIDTRHFNATHHFRHAKVHTQGGSEEKDIIDFLPGQPPVKFKQYGGYVTVNKSAGRAFYYYFAEAQSNEKSRPLLLWLNGGPGCSSLAYGAMQELGPFRVASDGKTLYKNKFAWNHAANVLFLESPAGVGFSYTNTSADLAHSGDKSTANDNIAFLVNWFERFPEYKGRDFYLSGESYAGHYVPQLAHTILAHNKAGKNIINLKGIIIGNAVINDETDVRGMYEYFASHALISPENWDTISENCDFDPDATKQSDVCDNAVNEAYEDIIDIDIYAIYAPMCHNTSLTEKPKKKTTSLSLDPCGDNYVYAYLNRPEVQEALHANVTKLPYDWQPCSNVLKKWQDSPITVIPLLNEFMANGLRVWVFSGDTDGRIPVTSTLLSIKQMKLPVATKWHPWYLDGEVAGYTQVYKGNMTFASVRGAGHQVPSYQPARSLSLISHFLAGTELPNSSGNL